jgi:hypothetical protein
VRGVFGNYPVRLWELAGREERAEADDIFWAEASSAKQLAVKNDRGVQQSGRARPNQHDDSPVRQPAAKTHTMQ